MSAETFREPFLKKKSSLRRKSPSEVFAMSVWLSIMGICFPKNANAQMITHDSCLSTAPALECKAVSRLPSIDLETLKGKSTQEQVFAVLHTSVKEWLKDVKKKVIRPQQGGLSVEFTPKSNAVETTVKQVSPIGFLEVTLDSNSSLGILGEARFSSLGHFKGKIHPISGTYDAGFKSTDTPVGQLEFGIKPERDTSLGLKTKLPLVGNLSGGVTTDNGDLSTMSLTMTNDLGTVSAATDLNTHTNTFSSEKSGLPIVGKISPTLTLRDGGVTEASVSSVNSYGTIKLAQNISTETTTVSGEKSGIPRLGKVTPTLTLREGDFRTLKIQSVSDQLGTWNFQLSDTGLTTLSGATNRVPIEETVNNIQVGMSLSPTSDIPDVNAQVETTWNSYTKTTATCSTQGNYGISLAFSGTF